MTACFHVSNCKLCAGKFAVTSPGYRCVEHCTVQSGLSLSMLALSLRTKSCRLLSCQGLGSFILIHWHSDGAVLQHAMLCCAAQTMDMLFVAALCCTRACNSLLCCGVLCWTMSYHDVLNCVWLCRAVQCHGAILCCAGRMPNDL